MNARFNFPPFSSELPDAVVVEISDLLQGILAAFPANTAVLDETGAIIAVNRAWCEFADNNGFHDAAYGIGQNYFEICHRAIGEDANLAQAAANGLRQIVAEGGSTFTLEYPCHSPDKQRWFLLRASGFDINAKRYVVVMHEDITQRILAEEQARSQARFPAENPNPVLRIAPNGQILYANDASLPILSEWGCDDSDGCVPAPWFELFSMSFELNQIRRIDLAAGERIYRLEVVPVRTSNYINAYGYDITEERKAETQLRESEERLRRFYNSGLLSVIYWNMDGQIVDANDKFLEMVGYDRDELAAGQIDWINMTPPEYRWLDERSIAELKATGVNQVPFEKQYIHKDGTRIPIILAGAMLDEARFNGVAFVLDNTLWKRAEEALKGEKERFRAVAESLSDVIYEWDIHDSVQWFGNIDPLLGYASGEFPRTLTGWVNSLHPDDRDRVWHAVEDQLNGKSAYDLEYRILHKAGKWRYWLARGAVLRDAGGTPYRWIGAVTDVTARKEAEVELRKLHTAMEQSASSVVITDLEGNIEYVNPAFTQVSGYSAQEVLGQNPRILQSGETPREVYQQLWAAITTGGEWHGELHNKKKNGDLYWELVSISAVKDTDGKVTSFLAVKDDITLRKQAEAALKASEIKYRRLFESAKDGILILNASSGQIEDVNPYLSELLGYPAGEFLGRQLWEIGAFKNKAASLVSFAELQSQKQVRYEDLPLETSDGRLIAVEFVSNVYRTGDRDVIQCNIRDITERKREAAELDRYREHLEELVDQRTAELDHAKQRLEGILDNTAEGIVLAYLERGIEQTNTMFNTLFHCAPDSYFGQPLRMLVLPE
ncbi:MAG: PAS domain S-box protein, partial [Chloroflexota bacterium]